MNIRQDYKKWFARQQVPAVMLLATGAILLFSYSYLLPLNRKKRDLQRQNEQKWQEVLKQNYGRDEASISRRKDLELQLHEKLRSEWALFVERSSAFPKNRRLLGAAVGHIDFKRELYDTRQRLVREAKRVSVALPDNLGMTEQVASDQDARELVLQLHAVEKVVRIVLELDVNEIYRVKPLPRLEYAVGKAEVPYLEEYPVFISFHGKMAALNSLFDTLGHDGKACFFRHLRIEKPDRHRQSILDVSMVLSSFVFTKKLDELPWPQIQRPGGLNPAGH